MSQPIKTFADIWTNDRRLAGLPGRFALFLIFVTVARLAAAAFTPLTEDEAYYRLWSAYPAFGYYDHPPMVAWWIAIGKLLLGDTALGVRLVAVFATSLVSLLIYRIAQLSNLSETAAVRAALLYNATILVGFGGQLSVPDSPSSLFWTATLFMLLKARGGEGDSSARYWLAAGLLAGLAVLSKYSALFLAPGVVLWLATSEDGRRRLLTPWPWLCALLAALVFSTNVLWNAGHDWVSFQKQFGRAAPENLTPRHLLELMASQAFLLNPLITPLALAGVIAAFSRRTASLDGRWLIVAVTLPFSAYLVIHSLHAGVQGHWPAPLYPGLAILAAEALDRLQGWRRRAGALATPFGLIVSGLALLHVALPATDWFGRMDLSAQMRGWPLFASRVEMVRAHVGATWVGSLSFGQVAFLDNTRLVEAPILQITERSRYQFQPPPPPNAMSGPGLVVDFSRRVSATDLAKCFGQVIPLGEINRGGDARLPEALVKLGLGPRQYTYALYRVSEPKVDLVRDGCWEAKTLADSLKARARRRKD
jgi:hypothetical protein